MIGGIKYFTRSANETQLGKLWLCLRCSKVFIVKLPSWNPTPGVEPNWYLSQYAFKILNERPHRMLLKCFAPISIRVTPRHFLVSDSDRIKGSLRNKISI